MDRVCVVFPILPAKTEDARAFQRELDTERKDEYARSERAIGITKELWYIAAVPSGDQFVVFMESPDFGRALGQFSQSQDPFDRWFKERLAAVTGVDLNNLPPDMQLPELVSTYEA
ncbi:MAG: hypothetical protein ACJ789_16945 [Thermomicrobiales bacterium]